MIDSTLKKANILIVDDQEANIDVLESFLEMQGYFNIKSTTDPRNVISMVSSFNPDLLLLDLSMPYLSGFEILEQIKNELPADIFLPIIVLTADITKESKQRSLANGASDFLTKPFDLIEVGLRIRNLLYTCYLHQQLQNQNQTLEEKVKERTYAFEKQNIELILAKEKAEESDRLKSSFLANMSHEIRTPLNSIIGFSDLLFDPYFDSDQQAEFVNAIKQNGNNLLTIITDIMDISQIEAGQITIRRSDFSIEILLSEMYNEFDNSCKMKGLEFRYSKPHVDSKIVGDKDKIKRIISNLVSNAIKFTERGYIEVSCNIGADSVQFYVKDTGIGISKENHDIIFERFRQIEAANTRTYGGNGLGLAIAKQLVERMGGRITLESEIGKGTTFYFSVPRS